MLYFSQCLCILLSTLPVLKSFFGSPENKVEVFYFGLYISVPTLFFSPFDTLSVYIRGRNRGHSSNKRVEGLINLDYISVVLIDDSMCDFGQ